MTPVNDTDLVDSSEGKMTFAEIEDYFRERRMRYELDALREAAAEETDALRSFDQHTKGTRKPSGRDRVKDARDFLAEDICGFLNGALKLTPEMVLAHRPRVTAAWALAELIKRKRGDE